MVTNEGRTARVLTSPHGLKTTENVCDIPHGFEATENVCYIPNKNRQNTILTGLPIFLGDGVAAHLGHQACR